MPEQQLTLYDAEAEVSPRRTFSSEEEMQQFADEIREADWWQRNFPQVRRIEVYFDDARDASAARWHPEHGAGVIGIAAHGHTDLTLMHEVAHVLANARYGEATHSPWFARTYLEAVYTYMGAEAYAELRAAFERHGIDHDTDNSNPAGRAV
ncbi:MAG: hypothetical protein KGL39_24450 [Patescibacteria group bacterium]|nr:hypothetical protein [Patescibacteria group bacterium]